MATTLSPSGLIAVDEYGAAGWHTRFNTNMTLLNSTRLKLSGLNDVNVTGLSHGQILSYSAATGKWVPITPPARKRLAFGGA